MGLAVRIEFANVIAVQCPHDANAREHRRPAERRDQDQRLIPQNRMRVKPTNRVSLRSEGARYGKRQVAARAHDRRFRGEGKKDHQKDQADDGWPTSQEGQSLRRPKGSWHAQEGQEGGEEDDRAPPGGGARTLTIAHHRDRRLIPIEVRPDVGASLVTGFAYEPRLEIGEPDVIAPRVRADRDRVAALVIRAIAQDPAHASVAHLGKGDLLRAGNHAQ
jgi:hypothetical protein